MMLRLLAYACAFALVAPFGCFFVRLQNIQTELKLFYDNCYGVGEGQYQTIKKTELRENIYQKKNIQRAHT